jgi:hypothetical protein
VSESTPDLPFHEEPQQRDLMAGFSRGRCRKCGAPIYWATTTTGKSTPLDARPVLGFRPVEGRPGVVEPAKVLQSHFATCPDADQHRHPRPSVGEKSAE